jgi:hypothetical protein
MPIEQIATPENLATASSVAQADSSGTMFMIMLVFGLSILIFACIVWEIARTFTGFYVDVKEPHVSYLKRLKNKNRVGKFIIFKDTSGIEGAYLIRDEPVIHRRLIFLTAPKFFIDTRYPFTTSFIERKLGTEIAPEYVSPDETMEVLKANAEKHLQSVITDKASMYLIAGVCLIAGVGVGYMLAGVLA